MGGGTTITNVCLCILSYCLQCTYRERISQLEGELNKTAHKGIEQRDGDTEKATLQKIGTKLVLSKI